MDYSGSVLFPRGFCRGFACFGADLCRSVTCSSTFPRNALSSAKQCHIPEDLNPSGNGP